MPWEIIHVPEKLPSSLEQSTVDVLASTIEPKLANNLVRQLNQIYPLENLRHVKRVRRRSSEGKVELSVILCLSREDENYMDGIPHDVLQLINVYQLCPFKAKVARYAALSKEQWEEQCKLWPTSYHPPSNVDGVAGFSKEDSQLIFNYMNVAIQLTNLSCLGDKVVNAAVIADPLSKQIIASARDGTCSGHTSANETSSESITLAKNATGLVPKLSPDECGQSYTGVSCLHPWEWTTQGPRTQNSVVKCESNYSWHPLRHATLVAIENAAARDRRLFPGSGSSEDGSKSNHCSDSSPAKRQKTQASEEDILAKDDLNNVSPAEAMRPYLCTGYDIYLAWEPCTMCAMALVHQRVRRIFYAFPNPNAGALGSVSRLQGEKSLNHHYSVFRILLPEKALHEIHMAGDNERRVSSPTDSQAISTSITSRRRGRGRPCAGASAAQAGTSTSRDDDYENVKSMPTPQGPSQSSPSETPSTSDPHLELYKMMSNGGGDDNDDVEGIGEVSTPGASSSGKRRGRGPSKGGNLEPPAGHKYVVQYNVEGNPIGIEAQKLSRRVGEYARDPKIMPLDCGWKEVPDRCKENLWNLILKEYDFQNHPNMKFHVFSIAQKSRKEFKSYLKNDCWKKLKGQELKDKINGRVQESEWDNMVRQWTSEEGMKKAAQNSKNRSCVKLKHHLGTRTMAQLEQDMIKDGEMPDHIDVYIKAHTPKDSAKDLETSAYLEEIQTLRQTQMASQGSCTLEPILTHVLGDNRGKYMRGKGSHKKRRDVATSEGQYSTAAFTKLMQRNAELTTTVEHLAAREGQLREEIEVSQQHRQKIETEMHGIRDMMMSLCRRLDIPMPAPNSQPDEDGSGSSGSRIAD